MKELKRLSSELFYNTPLLLSLETAMFYNEYLQSRNAGEIIASVTNPEERNKVFGATYNPESKIGVITVSGTLTNKPSMDLCTGETASYEKIQSFTDTLISKGAKTIVIEANSGGGQAYRMMETSKYIRDKADANGVKLIAYVDGVAASAMYGLISSCHEIIANPDASVGSIGVLIALSNGMKGKMKEGEVQFVTSGKGKIPFDETGEFRKEYIENLQARTDDLYEKFTSHVASYREITVEKLKEVGAVVFSSEKSLELKLIDDIKTNDEFRNYILSIENEGTKQKGKSQMSVIDNAIKMKELEDVVQAKELALSQIGAELESQKQVVASLTSEVEKLKGENASLVEKLSAVENEKLQAKENARKEKLLAIVGESKLEETLSLTSGMDDTKFESFAALLESNNSNVVMSKEVGSEGQPVAEDDSDEIEFELPKI